MLRRSPLAPSAGRLNTAARPRTRRAAPRLERLEERELLTIDFTSALGFGPASGASGQVIARAVAIDAGGATLVAGTIRSGPINFNPNPSGPPVDAAQNRSQIFVAKYSPAGSLIWVRVVGDGSTGADNGAYDLAVDTAGNVFTTGEFAGSIKFSASGPTFTTNGADGFVWKLDANGNTVWSQIVDTVNPAKPTVGSFALTYGIALTGGANPSAFITGTFGLQPNDTAKFGGITLTSGGSTGGSSSDSFVARLDSNGNYVWAKDFHTTTGAGPNFTERKGIALDASDNVYTTGQFSGTVDFDPARVKPAGIKTSVGSSTTYVVKLDANGNFTWADSFGGSGFSQGVRIAVNSAAGAVYAFGEYQGSTNFNPNPAGTPQVLNRTDGLFVEKLDTAGNFQFVRDLGVNAVGSALGPGDLVLDRGGNLDIIGSYTGTFHLGAATYTSPTSSPAAFFARMNSAGQFLETAPLPAAGSDTDLAVAINASGTIAVAGSYIAQSTPRTLGNFTLPAVVSGNTGAFVATILRHITQADYDGTGRTNVGVYDTALGTFYLDSTVDGHLEAFRFGQIGDNVVPLSGDYGRHRQDQRRRLRQTSWARSISPPPSTATWRPSASARSATSSSRCRGTTTAPARPTSASTTPRSAPSTSSPPSTATWRVSASARSATTSSRCRGTTTAPARPTSASTTPRSAPSTSSPPSTATWRASASARSATRSPRCRGTTTAPARPNVGVYDATLGYLYFLSTVNGSLEAKPFGAPQDKPIVLSGDFNGTGKTDVGVYDYALGTFYFTSSANGQLESFRFGAPQDHVIPLASARSSTPAGSVSGVAGAAIVRSPAAFPAQVIPDVLGDPTSFATPSGTKPKSSS